MQTKSICWLHLIIRPLGLILVLLLVANVSQQHPLQQQVTIIQVNQTISRPCITDHEENGTIIIEASRDQVVPTPSSTFNERRRDMFFDDYSIKQIQVIDTSVILNNSIHNGEKSDLGTNTTQLPTQELHSTTVSTTAQNEIVINSSVLNSLEAISVRPQRQSVLMPKLEVSGRPSCLKTPDDTFCETVDNYPKSSIKHEINFSVNQFLEIFGPKEIDGRTIVDVDQDESVCGKKPRIIYPQMAKNQANQWIYVVNEVEYTQAVVAEICDRPGEPCAYMDNLPIGMYSKCKQKYSYKRLLALHPTEKRTYSDSFRFPSCCSCHVKILDDFSARSKFRKLESKVEVLDRVTSNTVQVNSTVDDLIKPTTARITTNTYQ